MAAFDASIWRRASVRASQAAGVSPSCVMPESQAPVILILLWSCAGLLVLVLLLVFRISRRLARMESLIPREFISPETAEETPSAAETSPGGAFETFLNEEPGRREMTKGEQFAAYRRWRQENGMNWSNS